jgi:SNF2 family DNA or RNA helicase
MHNLHACYSLKDPHYLYFFGEDPEIPKKNKRGRKPKSISVRPHPHGLDHEALITSLNTYHSGPYTAERTSICLTLPSKGTEPLFPDETISDIEITSVPIEYQSLKVPLSDLIHLLPAMNSEKHDEIICQGSIAFFGYAFGFALECISRELFMPSSGKDGGDIGEWIGLYGPDERDRVKRLARSMPGICNACSDQAYQPDLVVKTFLDKTINVIIKEACHNNPLNLHGRARTGANPGALWLLMLWGEKPAETAGDILVAAAGQKAQEWLGDVTEGEKNRPFYTCIRLKEPAEGNVDFQLEFLIQAIDDPSLMISAEQVWKKGSGSITRLHHRFDRPQEQMLADLFRAGKIFPPIKEALRTRAPTGITLSPADVHPFLSEAAPILRQSNISVLLPAWWKDTSKKPQIRLVVKAAKKKGKSASGSGFFSRDTLLSFDWEIAIGDVTISAEEFAALVTMKTPLVQIGGKWVAFNPADLRHAIETFQRQYPDGIISTTDALRLGLTGTDESGLQVEVTGADKKTIEFLSPLLAIDDKRAIHEEPVPLAFRGELRPYQKKGLSWLSFITGIGFGACLADDMGLGKTIQLIAYLLAVKAKGVCTKNLLICPMSLIGNWQRELARFAPDLSVYIHHGTCRVKDAEFEEAASGHDLVLSTYQLTHRDQEVLTADTWDLVVLDEAQNIKNSSTRQAKAVRALRGERRIAMTGTPVENRLSELWSIMEFLSPGDLGGEKAFERQYSTPIEKYHDTGASERLQALVRPFILRRVKTDKSIISDLPEKNVMKRYCTLTSEQATLYQAVVESMINGVDEAEGIARKGMILAALTRLKQICNHPDAFLDDGKLVVGRSGKIDLLFSLIEDVLATGDAAILFTQYPTFGERLAGLIRKTFHEEVLFLHGKTPRSARDEMVQRFAHPAGPRLFLLSLKAGGVGLNLTRASHVFHIDRWWNPAVEDQATDRAFRIGQQKNVAVHLLISAGTLEERIDLLMEEKRNLAGSIIGTGEDWITSLSTSELRDLLSLRGEMIGGA